MAKEQPSVQDAVICYPSGNTAVVCSGDGLQHVVTAFSDSRKPKVLVMFSSQGVGCVSYPSGKPWLVVKQDGWSVSDVNGRVMERGKFPRKVQKDIRCDVTEQLQVAFSDQDHITLSFIASDQVHSWPCGQRLRRTDCTVQTDVKTIRARQATVGSLFVTKSPHATPAQQAGLGGLRSMLGKLSQHEELRNVVSELQMSDSRILRINTLPQPVYGTARCSTASSTLQTTLPGSEATENSTAGAAQHTLDGISLTATASATGTSTAPGRDRPRSVSSPLLPDFGRPDMTIRQRKWQHAGQHQRQGHSYEPQRQKLQPLSLDDLQQTVQGPDSAKDMLHCVCILSDWNPVCKRLQPKLEAGWQQLLQDAKKEPSGPATHIKVYSLDASEGRLLQQQLDFRTCPMFLMYYDTRLVHANNNICTKDELVTACYTALERGRKGETLGQNFTFCGRDNTVLDYITPHMTLTGA